MNVYQRYFPTEINGLLKHPDYERILQEVLNEQYKMELFELVSIESKDKIHAQALYIQARLRQQSVT